MNQHEKDRGNGRFLEWLSKLTKVPVDQIEGRPVEYDENQERALHEQTKGRYLGASAITNWRYYKKFT